MPSSSTSGDALDAALLELDAALTQTALRQK
jgi:hypothetical protein